MPLAAPLYTTTAVAYEDALVATAICSPSPGSPLPLPPPLAWGGGTVGSTAIVLFADYRHSTIGPYREVVILLPVVLDPPLPDAPDAGWFCPLIYVTTDVALAQGRELWGFPKKFGHISIQVSERAADDTRTVRASLERNGEVLCRLEGSVREPVAADTVSELLSVPIFNHRLIWAVDGTHRELDEVTVVQLDGSLGAGWTGTGRLEASGEVARCIGSSADALLLAGEGDFVLPAGRRIRRPSEAEGKVPSAG